MSDQNTRAAAGRANRLASQTSPYLLQHAHNPVDWRPWGPEAFEEARRRDVPIFLSVGYSTCYWCHVMERESFEDEATARQMNEGFVCVKVDREERPDVDDLYMAATQAFTGRGGWPMSVAIEPRTLRPFWAGTYFPTEPRHGLPSFRQVLASLSKAWAEQRDEVLSQAEALAGAVAEHMAAEARPVALGADQVAQAVSTLMRIHDRANGGFGQGAPKFPQPSYTDLLLAFRQAANDEETRRAVDAAVRTTLDKMACGGMFDQVGGGFHRYSVDEKWIVPHFEKMLYDNGQLVETYAAAASVYGDAFYARTAQRTAEYALREMASPEGAFYSAQDAEVNHREGQNYLWTREQLDEVLGADDGAFAARVYGVDRGANFRDPHHPQDPPSNVLYLVGRPEAVAQQAGMSVEALIERLDGVNDRLYAARQERDQPHRDEKILAGWNGMMIAGLAVASVVLDEPRYAESARRAADFVLSRMREPGGGLLRVYGGRAESARAHTPAFLEDYAYVVHGLVQLHRALVARGQTGAAYLDAARALAEEVERRFGDADGGYYDTLADQPDLFIRGRSTYDGAVPSGVSVMLNDLVDLFELTGEEMYLDRAAAGLSAISAAIASSPVATVNSTRALLRMLVSPAGAERVRERSANAAPAPAASDEPGAAPESEDQPLEVYAPTDRVLVKEGEPGGFLMEIVIAEGAHVLAAEPGTDAAGLTGLRLEVIGGAGVAVYAEWPDGEPYGPDGGLRAYTGRISVPVVLERQGEWSGRPLLALRYQVCTETECLPPGAVELAVAIDRG